MTHISSGELLDRFRAGDERAADELFARFADRLASVAAARLSEKMRRRIDPEDVVQSAYRSFFVQAKAGRFDLQRSGDLWRLLVRIMLHKLHGQTDRHTAGKRAVAKEQAARDASSEDLVNFAIAREPTPFEAIAFADEVENMLRGLEPNHRKIVELRLQGNNQAEIAEQLQCSERTVRRVLEQLKNSFGSGDGG